MKLSTLSILLGLGMAAPNLYALANPAKFAAAARKFPRSLPLGYFLMILATAWFIWNVQKESIADFEPMKPFLYALFIGVGIGTCVFVKDFLAARGFAVLLLLLAKVMVDAARWTETDWRLLIVTMAYVWILVGIWLTISPWRLRDMINWSVANDRRLKVASGVRLGFALLLVVLGFTAFK